MAFKLPKLNIKGVLGNITSNLNIKAPDIKQELDKKYGLGEFAGLPTEKRRKPGESEYNYRTRMNVLERRNRSFNQQETTDPVDTTIVPETNKDDLREKTVTNFGITPDMSFNQAFAQAGAGGAKRGDVFEFRGNKFLYEFEQGNEEQKEEQKEEVIVENKEQDYPLPPPPPADNQENRDIIDSNEITRLQNEIERLNNLLSNETSYMRKGRYQTQIDKLNNKLRQLQ
jgi:hypothetical protein|tara:strand:- start:206 stop:889 length:684 start_codon:yes stop_codon:yes gene_type:complete